MVVRDLATLVAFDAPRVPIFISISVWKMDKLQTDLSSLVNDRFLDPQHLLWYFQAPRPSTGPHKLRECLPLIIFLRNRLKYALTGDEVKKICMQRFIKIDGKVRTDITYPTGFMGE